MEFNEAKIPSRLAQMRPLIHDGEKSSFLFQWYVQMVEVCYIKQKQFTFSGIEMENGFLIMIKEN